MRQPQPSLRSLQSCTAALANDIGRWKLSLGNGSASATLHSLNTLTTGTRTIDYHPMLTISCDAEAAIQSGVKPSRLAGRYPGTTAPASPSATTMRARSGTNGRWPT